MKWEVFVMTRVFVERALPASIDDISAEALTCVAPDTDALVDPVIDSKVIHCRRLSDDATPESLV